MISPKSSTLWNVVPGGRMTGMRSRLQLRSVGILCATTAVAFAVGRATAVDAPRKAEVLSVASVLARNPPVSDEAFKIIPVIQGQDASAILVRAQKELKPHYHASREEIVYVIRGGGTMTLGGEKRPVKAGDVIYIPRGQAHGFVNGAKRETVVFSVMAPPFDGKDRIYLEGKAAPSGTPAPSSKDSSSSP